MLFLPLWHRISGQRRRSESGEGIRKAVGMAFVFCVLISCGVFFFARPLLLIFVQPQESEILAAGVEYLRIEGAFYCGIGCLFLLYGFYRAVKLPGMSVVLTVISLGTRVVLAYLFIFGGEHRGSGNLVVGAHWMGPG